MALVLAIAAAVAYGAGSLLQAVGARRARSTVLVWREPAYLAGLGLDGVAWLLSLVALRTLPIYLVQTVLAGSLAVTALGARAFLGTVLRRADGGAIAVTVVGLALLAGASGTQTEGGFSTAVSVVVAASAVALAAAGWWTARRARAGREWAVVGCAVVAGAAFGGAAIAVHGITVGGSWPAEPAVWALVVFGVTGALLYAAALEHGNVARVTAVLWTVEVVVPSSVGFAWLGDTVRSGWIPAAVAGFALAIAAALVLAGSPAQEPATA
ncbi:hypothetical protein [Cryptosporangium phraense]|uniref:DMT family transporter n=1 Tax=Cryptosporangium phraense TaxID=2593070 RepID=A0A545AV46_9ACTN|nr:hypothetical protein [Cryptosporangium phraense]TQS45208.1 hypothetical protein FL583_08885 [Cryptosporangium phraense]